jgi:hypothetical protein
MAETWFTTLKALDAHIATLQKTRAQGAPQTATWSKLQEELERIVPRSNGDSETPPALTSNFIKQLETPKWTTEESAVWAELRAEFEALRLRIRADLDAYRSRKKLEGKGS